MVKVIPQHWFIMDADSLLLLLTSWLQRKFSMIPHELFCTINSTDALLKRDRHGNCSNLWFILRLESLTKQSADLIENQDLEKKNKLIAQMLQFVKMVSLQKERYNEKREDIKRAYFICSLSLGLVILQTKFGQCFQKLSTWSTKERINNYGSIIPSRK